MGRTAERLVKHDHLSTTRFLPKRGHSIKVGRGLIVQVPRSECLDSMESEVIKGFDQEKVPCVAPIRVTLLINPTSLGICSGRM